MTTEFRDTGAASLIGWWRDAGVDTLIEEEPRNWLARVTPLAPSAPAAPVLAKLPSTLPEFIAWLLGDAAVPEGGPAARRVAPMGSPASDLMILADVPEAGDAEAGALFTGEAGALLDRMLGALGRNRASVYLATMTPGRPAGGRLTADAADRLAPIARRHVELAAPGKLWLIGRAASRALLEMDEGEAAGRLHAVNLEAVTLSAIATVHPRMLLDEEKGGERRMRKAVWADMQLLIGGPAA